MKKMSNKMKKNKKKRNTMNKNKNKKKRIKKRKMIKKIKIKKIVRRNKRINHKKSRRMDNTFMTRMETKLKIVYEFIRVEIPTIISINIILEEGTIYQKNLYFKLDISKEITIINHLNMKHM